MMENALSCIFMMENALSCIFMMGNAVIMMENALSFMMKKVILTQNLAHECDQALLNTEIFSAL